MKMAEELPILKGILKGNFSYHNARKCKRISFIHHIDLQFSNHSVSDSSNNKKSTASSKQNAIEGINKNASWMMCWTIAMNHGRSLVDWPSLISFICFLQYDDVERLQWQLNKRQQQRSDTLSVCVIASMVKCMPCHAMTWNGTACLYYAHSYRNSNELVAKWLRVQCWNKILLRTFKAIPSK